MGKPSLIDSSEKIGGRSAATTTRGSRRTDKVHRTDARGPSINGIHGCIRGSLRRSVDERCIGPGEHFMKTRM